MSLLFYRRPDYLGHDKQQLTESKCASYLEAAEASKPHIPKELCFDEIVKNNTLPPCSLNDFMDYLMYVEYNAECLQFFLWYCDYVERWSGLPKERKELSPAWDPSKMLQPRSTAHSRSRSLSEQTERMNRILLILEKDPKDGEGAKRPGRKPQRTESNSTNFSWPRGSSLDTKRTNEETGSEWQQFSAQPFRDEMTRIVRHYISSTGPRQLNLTHSDRNSCMQAVQQTTHPSTLLPAFAAAEALLKGQSHPNFIRWSVSNSNRPRVIFMRWLAAALIVLGFALDAVLVLSGLNRFIRMTALPLWCIGFSFLVASRHGLCIILHWNYKRNLRPWEQFSDEDFSGSVLHENDKADSGDNGSNETKAKKDNTEKEKNRKSQHKKKSPSTSSRIASADLQGKPSLQCLGGPIAFDEEPWVGSYQNRSGWNKVFEVSIVTQNKHLRAMQDRVTFEAMAWGTLLALGLATGSVFIPSGNFY
ncbi:regulator of G protein-like protein [Pseudomassariella vexata]|uniref:Regulator of G protein-like protein n=1 Tax=Pseudomassariella vexata TaxID=1141098 RepID=A0A1Y2D798_9PEZI|nr:regulator of G protein-like protein [Pseudomassariella vexata]ORY55077.1 regulator of G protein-like protein [Pseudomassariella vexata]